MTVPHTFSSGSVISATEVNENFTALDAQTSALSTGLAASTGAQLVGTTESGTVQAALLARAKLSTLASPGGASLVGIENGGTVQDFADVYANAVFSASYASVTAAQAAASSAGKTYVVVNSAWTLTANFTATLKIIFTPGFTVSCGAYTLNLSNGFQADDAQQVFLPGDAENITLPKWQRLTPQHFGAKADYVSSGSPGTDDGAALQAWASKLCTRVMPAGKYGTTITINWNGDADGTANVNNGMQCDPQAWIYQRTDNIPIMTVWGSRGVWQFPILEYSNRQASTAYGAVGLLVSPYPGQTGWYSNVISRIMVRGGANVGYFVPPAISSPVATALAGGETSVVTAYAQTDALGNYPWVPGMWAQILLNSTSTHKARITSVASTTTATTLSSTAATSATSVTVTSATGFAVGKGIAITLDSGSTHLTTITSVVGTTIGITTATPSQATSGNAASATQTTLGLSVAVPTAASVGNAVQVSGATPATTFSVAEFSNTIAFVFVDEPVRYGFMSRGTGTGDAIANMYIRSAGSGDPSAPTYTIENAVYISGTGAGSIAQLNVEYLGMNSNAIFISSRHFKLGEVHIEGVRSYGNSTGLISGSIADMDIDLVQVEYWTVFNADIANGAGILWPRAAAGTALGSGRGQWRVKQLNTRKNIMDRPPPNGHAFVAGYTAGTLTQVKIDNWTYNRDGGIYPSGQIVTPSNVGGLVAIGNLLPPDCVAFLFDVDTNSTSYQRIFTSPKGQYKVREILALKPSLSQTTATCGVYADNTGTTLISNVNNQALSTLTDTAKVLSIPLAASEATVLRAGSGDMFYKGNAAQALPAAVVTGAGGTSYLTGRSGGDNNTNLAFITFNAAHGFLVGDVVVITGSTNATSLNGKRYKIVDVPSTTQIVVYADSAAAIASAADIALSVQRIPTVHIVVTGTDVANFNAW